jgi:hypothetical protein
VPPHPRSTPASALRKAPGAPSERYPPTHEACVRWRRSATGLWRFRRTDPYKVRLWLGILGLLVVASVLGAGAHGLAMSDQLRDALWQPLFLSLGLMLGLIAVVAVYDRWGTTVVKRVLPIAVAAALGFYGITVITDGLFLVFVAYEAIAMTFALAVYSQLAVCGRAGAALIAVGVVVTLIAAIVQQTGWTVTLIWPLDPNGVFHLIQMPGLLLMTLGVRQSLRSPTAAVS